MQLSQEGEIAKEEWMQTATIRSNVELNSFAKQINNIRHSPGLPFWQRVYNEHIIRNEKDLNNIRDCIINNPLKWTLDEENPEKKP